MVDTQTRLTPTASLQSSLVQHLQQVITHQLTSQTLVQWAETLHWQLLEGAHKTDQTPATQALREILSDILLQWECLQAHHHETSRTYSPPLEFPSQWLTAWLQQIQSIQVTPMSTINFNNSVGIANVNSTLHGDQIGIQNNQTVNPELQAVLNDIQTLITQLQTQYPTVNTETEALAIIDAEFTEIRQTPTHKLATLRQQILNPERHLQALKAVLNEIVNYYLEENIWGKAAIVYLDKMSEDPKQGA
ncbi:hypothetical protein [Trichothermofontia sp.]